MREEPECKMNEEYSYNPIYKIPQTVCMAIGLICMILMSVCAFSGCSAEKSGGEPQVRFTEDNYKLTDAFVEGLTEDKLFLRYESAEKEEFVIAYDNTAKPSRICIAQKFSDGIGGLILNDGGTFILNGNDRTYFRQTAVEDREPDFEYRQLISYKRAGKGYGPFMGNDNTYSEYNAVRFDNEDVTVKVYYKSNKVIGFTEIHGGEITERRIIECLPEAPAEAFEIPDGYTEAAG